MLNLLKHLGYKRKARRVTRMLRARFDAAVTNVENARHWSNADGLSADAAASPHVRRTLRNRSRYEVANNSYAKGTVLTLANDAVGTGPRLQMLTDNAEVNRRIEQRFAEWSQVVDLAGLEIPAQNLPIRLDHERRQGVGHTQRLAVENGKLIAEGLISRDTTWARDIAKSGSNGFPWQASIGAEVVEADFIPVGQSVRVNGQQFTGPLHVVQRAILKEISFVDSGADTGTSAKVAAQQLEEQTMETKETNDTKEKTMNVDTPNTTEATKETPSDSKSDSEHKTIEAAASQTTNLGEQAVEDFRKRVATEATRIATVQKICDGKHPAIEAKAIEGGWDTTRTELEVLRASRPKAPAVHTGGDDLPGGQVLEAAAMLTGGIRGDDLLTAYGEQAVDTASKKYRGGIGLQELLLEAAWANGYTGRNFRDSRTVLRFAFAPFSEKLQAGFSTIDVGGILSNVSNKFLLEGFFSVERTWRNICAVRNVSDFKTVTSYRLIGKDQYEIVAPGGELKHGSLGEESYTNRADTYGLTLSVDRRDVINDDLGAITTGQAVYAPNGALVAMGSVNWDGGLAGYGDITGKITVADSALLKRMQSAAAAGFTPAQTGDWNATPADIKSALDELASRVKTLER